MTASCRRDRFDSFDAPLDAPDGDPLGESVYATPSGTLSVDTVFERERRRYPAIERELGPPNGGTDRTSYVRFVPTDDGGPEHGRSDSR